MRAQVIRRNTKACTNRPVVEGQPEAFDMMSPSKPLTTKKVCGFATIKNNVADIRDIKNFFSCFLPSQPQPQSLKAPIFTLYPEKNQLKARRYSIV